MTFHKGNALTLPAPAKGRSFYRSADGPTGFRLMVTQTGHRTYYLQYKPRGGGPARWAQLGRVGEVSYKHAREQAEALRGEVAKGRDPVAEMKEARRRRAAASPAVSVRECIGYYLSANRQHLDPKTVQAYEQTQIALPPSLMESPAESLTPARFREAVREATRAPIMQNRHLARLKAVLRFAHTEQKIQLLPPLIGMRRPNVEKRRERVLTADEVRALWRAVDDVAAALPRGGPSFAASVRLMLLLGSRLGETGLATWKEFDLDGRSRRSDAVPEGQPVWYIPAEHRKGERGKKRPHWIPLPPLAVAVLRELHTRTADKPLVFWKAGYSGRTYMLRRLLGEMGRLGQAEPWTYHDLRRTCSTWLGELGCPDELNDLLLGHQKRGVIAHYDHSKRIADRADWLRKWADRVAEIAGLKGDATIHLYEVAGQPILSRTRRPDLRGHRHVGVFTGREARALAEEMRRKAEAALA